MIYDQIIEAIAEGEAEETLELTKQALAQGYPAGVVLEKALMAGMNSVAEKFRARKVVVPEVLMATRAMHAGLAIVEPLIKGNAKRQSAKFVIGTVAGDLHDIGLTLVKMMAVSTGGTVIDLGVDVTPKKFAATVRKENPDFLMMSSLLTTTMPAMKEVIQEITEQGMRKGLKIMVGGAPVDEAFAKEIGADYYFADAFELRDFLEENINKLVAKRNR